MKFSKPTKLTGNWAIYGNESVDGDALWGLFCAAAKGDAATIEELLAQDARLVHGQYWYSDALRFAVLAGHANAVERLLKAGSEPGILEANLYDWETHLKVSEARSFDDVHALLINEMYRRYRSEPYSREFVALREAIEADGIDEAKRMLRKKPKLNTISDIRGKSALHWAARVGSIELIDFCVENGADVNIHDADGEPSIGVETKSKGGVQVGRAVKQRLLEHGAEYDFHTACFLGDKQRVDEFVAADATLPKKLNHACVSPLASAALGGQCDMVAKLLDLGADPNMCERRYASGGALFIASCHGYFDVAELLLKRGADPNGPCESSGTSADHAANQDILDLLTKHGSQGRWDAMDHTLPDLRESIIAKRHDLDGDHRDSLIGQVIREGDTELLSLYIENMGTAMIERAHPGLGRSGWFTPTGASIEFLQQLTNAGFDVSRPDWLGRTHLHFLANRGDVIGVKFLLDQGADINHVCLAEKWTPLGYAARGNRKEMVQLLLKHCADPSLPRDSPGTQPMSIAKSRGFDDIVEVLESSI